MSAADFEALRGAVVDDTELRARLAAPSRDVAEFSARVVGAAAERGLVVTAEDVAAAMAEGRRSWLERWVR